MEILKLPLQKVVAAAYGRWSFTRVWDPKYRAITGNALVFWIGGRLWRVLLFCSDPVLGQLTRQIHLGTRYVYSSLLFVYPPVEKMPVYNMSTREWCCMCYQVCHVTFDCRAACDCSCFLFPSPSPVGRRTYAMYEVGKGPLCSQRGHVIGAVNTNGCCAK